MSYCEFVTLPLVSWVRCGTWLYRFLIFAPLLTMITNTKFSNGPSIFSNPICYSWSRWHQVLCYRYCSYVGSHLTSNFTLYLNSRWLKSGHGLKGGAGAAVNLPVAQMCSASSLWMVSLYSGMLASSSDPPRSSDSDSPSFEFHSPGWFHKKIRHSMICFTVKPV